MAVVDRHVRPQVPVEDPGDVGRPDGDARLLQDLALDGLPGALQDVAPAAGQGPEVGVRDLADEQDPAGAVEDAAAHVELGGGVPGDDGCMAVVGGEFVGGDRLHQVAGEGADAVEALDVEGVRAVGEP